MLSSNKPRGRRHSFCSYYYGRSFVWLSEETDHNDGRKVIECARVNCLHLNSSRSRSWPPALHHSTVASLAPALTKSHRDAAFASCAEEQWEEAVVKGRVRLGGPHAVGWGLSIWGSLRRDYTVWGPHSGSWLLVARPTPSIQHQGERNHEQVFLRLGCPVGPTGLVRPRRWDKPSQSNSTFAKMNSS